MARSGWREVRFVGGRLDGQVRMVVAGPTGHLADEIRVEAPAGQHEVYELVADDIEPGGDRWTYRHPRYTFRA